MKILFIVLANAQKPWALGVFEGIRKMALSSSGKIVGLAVVIASLIITLLLARLAYKLMSDEQSSGFGQVDVKEILRPFIILVMINAYPLLIGTFDGLVNGLSTSIMASLDLSGPDSELGSIMDEANRDWESLEVEGLPELGLTPSGISTGSYLASFGGANYSQVPLSNAEDYESEAEANMSRKERREMRKIIKVANAALRNVTKAQEKLAAPITWFTALFSWLFKVAYYIMEASAEVILCILALLGPIAFVLALFDSTKDSIKNFFLRYAQISIWKVLAAVIMWVIQMARVGGYTYMRDANLAIVNAAASGAGAEILNMTQVKGGTVMLLTIVFYIAGMKCLFSIPSIAGSIIQAAIGGEAVGGSGAAAGAAVGAVKGAAGKAGNLAKAGAKAALGVGK